VDDVSITLMAKKFDKTLFSNVFLSFGQKSKQALGTYRRNDKDA
jgi:hypothetical protein